MAPRAGYAECEKCDEAGGWLSFGDLQYRNMPHMLVISSGVLRSCKRVNAAERSTVLAKVRGA